MSTHTHNDEYFASCFQEPIRTFVRDTPNAVVAKAEAGLPLTLQIAVSNGEKDDVLISGIVFDVLDIGEVKGGVSGPLFSRAKYIFDLKYKKGEQEFPLMPKFVVAGNQISAFDIKLHTTSPGVGLCWKLKIRLRTKLGVISSEEFAIVMNGKKRVSK